MKKILCIITALFGISLYAQDTPKYNDYVQWMDSLKNEYSIKKFINSVDLKYEFVYNFGNLSDTEQNLLIDKIEQLYNQQEYIGLYGLAGCYLDRFYSFPRTKEIRSRMIEINYDKICYMTTQIIDFGESNYYTQYAKDRLLDIAEKRWNEEDLKAWSILFMQTLNMDKQKKDVQKIMKETNRQGVEMESFLLDSMIQKGVENNLQANINRPIYKRCIMMMGSLNDQRFIPSLERMIEEYKDYEDYPQIKKASIYALAKLGVQKYLDEVYNGENYIHYRYLGTKEAFLKDLDKSFVWNKGGRIFTNQKMRPMALAALDDALMFGAAYLKNVPKEITFEHWDINYVVTSEDYKNYDPSKDEKNKEAIEQIYKLYNWIKDNPDKWDIPPAWDGF